MPLRNKKKIFDATQVQEVMRCIKLFLCAITAILPIVFSLNVERYFSGCADTLCSEGIPLLSTATKPVEGRASPAASHCGAFPLYGQLSAVGPGHGLLPLIMCCTIAFVRLAVTI